MILFGPLARLGCEPRQARKGATVAANPCAGVRLGRIAARPSAGPRSQARATALQERCPSGRRSTPGKCVCGNASRVRIPPSPPLAPSEKPQNVRQSAGALPRRRGMGRRSHATMRLRLQVRSLRGRQQRLLHLDGAQPPKRKMHGNHARRNRRMPAGNGMLHCNGRGWTHHLGIVLRPRGAPPMQWDIPSRKSMFRTFRMCDSNGMLRHDAGICASGGRPSSYPAGILFFRLIGRAVLFRRVFPGTDCAELSQCREGGGL